MKTSSAKAKGYICSGCEKEFHNQYSHNSHKRHCGKTKGWINGDGYRMIFVYGRGSIREHRYIMEQHLGRELLPEEHIHHKNGNKLDNRLSNLEIIDIETHGRISGKCAKGIPKPNNIGNTNGVGWYEKWLLKQ